MARKNNTRAVFPPTGKFSGVAAAVSGRFGIAFNSI
jgi:hypothetical protein